MTSASLLSARRRKAARQCVLVWKRFSDRFRMLNHRCHGLGMWSEAGGDGGDDTIGMQFFRDAHNRGIRQTCIVEINNPCQV